MSYEGYAEYLCANGHYKSTADDDGSKGCRHCDAAWAYWHPVNETNGYDPVDTETYEAAKKEDGYDDIWKVDHYGNKYAEKILRYRPVTPEEEGEYDNFWKEDHLGNRYAEKRLRYRPGASSAWHRLNKKEP